MSPKRQIRWDELNSPPMAMNSSPMTVGYWYKTAAGGSSGIRNEGSLEVAPLLVARDCVLDAIALNITVVGTTGAVLRMGIYKDKDGLPSGLLLDAGTVAGDGTTGFKSITISQPIERGMYWVGAACQGGAGTRPTTTVSISSLSCVGDPSGNAQTGSYAGYANSGSVSGALPSTFTVSAFSGAPFIVWLRASS